VQERIPVMERLFPYQGTWQVSWVIQRYFRAGIPSLTPTKTLNAARALTEMKMGITRVRSLPFVLRVEPCNICNLRCPSCVCGTGRDPRPKGFMSMGDFRHILEENRAACLLRIDGMGESTLHSQLPEMIRLAKSYRLSVTLSSNFNTPACAKPEGFLDSGLDRLVVAIDGATQDTYARYRVGGELGLAVSNLRRLVEARRKLRRRRPVIEVQFIEFDWNREELPVMRRLAREWGADRLTLCAPDRTAKEATYNPHRPRRCGVPPVRWTLAVVGVASNRR
jgi:MoaA/NifB/PqqE/SkfB family radical SAM enzyme